MLSTETVQKLLREADYLDTKPAQEHDMSRWVRRTECCTASCAVGDMMLRGEIPSVTGHLLNPVPHQDFHRWYEAIGLALGIPERDAEWLFENTRNMRVVSFRVISSIRFHRSFETPAQTAARIRKYVYWKLRKGEILADEGARYREGDWRVDREVLSQVESSHA